MGKRNIKKDHYELGAALTEEKKIEVLKQTFREKVGYEPDLENPKTFNEKINWYKLYYQDTLITQCCDKFAVKDYVKEKVGDGYVVPTIAYWTDPDEIDFDKLPDKFALKVNWSSGYNIIVSDKSKLDIKKTREKLKSWIQPDRNSYYQYFNWGYKHMKPVIYAEEYIEQFEGQVYDYKFFMCNGEYEFMFIATDRLGGGLTYTYFDKNFEKMPFTYGDKLNAHPTPDMPKNLDKMLELARKLAEPFPFVRIDFYEIGDKIYLGEMTFYTGGGILPFNPREYDYILGEKIPVPAKKIIDKDDSDELSTKVKVSLKKKQLALKNGLSAVRRKIVRKEMVGRRKYVVVFGRLRFPYETHYEVEDNDSKKYITIKGVELCFKKTEKRSSSVNTNTGFKYENNTPLQAFMMEDKITPEIQKIHCEQKGYKQLGYFPNLKNPRSLNEKIMWLALYYKNPDIAVATDKHTAKEWIGNRIGKEYVVPLLGVYDDVNDIDFKKLPEQFVAKLNDGWGNDQVMIVRDKSTLDIDKTKAVLSSWLYPWCNYYYQNMCITDEKMEKPKIVIEEYLEAGTGGQLEDYKFYCCNGEPKFALVVAGRGSKDQTRSFVDMNWNVLPFARKGKEIAMDVCKPENLDEMMRLCRELSATFPFVRIDFYEVNGKVYVGEMTFTPGMFLKFNPKGWDFKLGEYLTLPELD